MGPWREQVGGDPHGRGRYGVAEVRRGAKGPDRPVLEQDPVAIPIRRGSDRPCVGAGTLALAEVGGIAERVNRAVGRRRDYRSLRDRAVPSAAPTATPMGSHRAMLPTITPKAAPQATPIAIHLAMLRPSPRVQGIGPGLAPDGVHVVAYHPWRR